jgi:hypothetical protein
MSANPPDAISGSLHGARLGRPPLRVAGPADDGREAPWFSRESLRGWTPSLAVHGAILLAMAFWVLSPPSKPERIFDTRLAGSDMGVEDGLTLAGGLNTPLELSASPDPAPEPTLASLKPLDLSTPEPKLTSNLSGASKPSAGGGIDNKNPGAGNGDGFGLARFGDGGESIRGIQVKVGDPQFTLLWDTEVDLDLHVVEPGGKEIYWEEPKGKQGGELDVDNTKGFGPENIYWLRDGEDAGKKVKGPGPPGEYKWFVVYWGGFGGESVPTRWRVRIKHDGKVTIMTGKFKALNERSRVYTLKVEPGSKLVGSSANP